MVAQDRRCSSGGSAHRVLTYAPEKNEAIWEGSVILPTDPIPE